MKFGVLPSNLPGLSNAGYQRDCKGQPPFAGVWGVPSFSPSPPPQETPRAYVSGESYRYLGRQYRLKVLEDQLEGVKHERGFIYVTVRAKNDIKRVQAVLEQWYRDEARHIFYERLKACYARVERLGIPYPPLAIRSMKTRWGSCSRSGLVTLNPRLVQTPKDCIDYVLLHELCHLKEHNHSKQYYQLLDQTLPNWRERRQKLNRFEF